MEAKEFFKTEKGIKGLYYFDMMFLFRLSKRQIRLGHFYGWENLHEFFLYRKKFHEDLKQFKK